MYISTRCVSHTAAMWYSKRQLADSNTLLHTLALMLLHFWYITELDYSPFILITVRKAARFKWLIILNNPIIVALITSLTSRCCGMKLWKSCHFALLPSWPRKAAVSNFMNIFIFVKTAANYNNNWLSWLVCSQCDRLFESPCWFSGESWIRM